jgi:lipopolysaccharide export system protein LptA
MTRLKNNPILSALCAAALLVAAMPHHAIAEKADREKPVNIESDRLTANDAKKMSTFEGKVVLTQGTLTLRGDRLVVRQDADGFQHGVAYGNPATFRQKRDGSDEYVYGEALRLEYDGKADRVEFFDRARLRRDGGDDVQGSYISYDSRTENFSVRSNKEAAAQGEDTRVKAVIMPKKKPAGAAGNPADAAESKPAPVAPGARQDEVAR